MAKVPQITSRDQVTPDKRHIVDEIAGSRGRVSNPFSVLLHNSEITGRAAHLGTYIRFESTLPGPLVSWRPARLSVNLIANMNGPPTSP